MLRRAWVLFAAAGIAACGGEPEPAGSGAGGGSGAAGTKVVFDLDADLSDPEQFFAAPFPSDLRLGPGGTPDVRGLANPIGVGLIEGLRFAAAQRRGFPVIPVAWFAFTAPMPALDPTSVIAADASSPVLLVDVDPGSPERGRLFPTVATALEADRYTAENVVAVAPRPGIVLHPERRYAFVIRRSLGDAAGRPLGVARAIADLAAGRAPEGARGAAALELFAPLWPALETAGVPASEVAAATVFTTGDVVADTAALSSAVREAYAVTIEGLAIDPDDGADHDRFCELHGTMKLPQFQPGVPPFDTEGLFEIGADGLPELQREEEVPVVVALPKTPMPAKGYPLAIYVHGSGGLSTTVIDRGPQLEPGGPEQKGKGPAYVLAEHGIASAGSALPVNPERLPGASDIEYINFNNLVVLRDTFRQGMLEQRLFLEALRTLVIPKEVAAGCGLPEPPAGAAGYFFDAEKLVASGQSMGGMYTNLVAAVEPRIRAVVPTGAGGFWTFFVLTTKAVDDIPALLGALLGTQAPLSFMHPVLHLGELALEPVDPLVYVPRLARRPLPGHPARPIYEPVGKDDFYFDTATFDAMALAYGNQQAGEEVWPSLQETLALADDAGMAEYPVRRNRTSEEGETYTGVVVQYEADGIADAHYIYAQRDEVKYQYGCFLATFLKNGIATVPAPAPLGTPCPE